MKLRIPTSPIFEPLLAPARYKGAYGGRGSGKSHFFAEALIEDHLRIRGLRSVCVREIQKSLRDSSKKLLEDKIQALGVGHLFTVLEREIRTPGGGVILFQGLQDHTAESIKSLEGCARAWVEEAQTLSPRSWELLRPTIRAEKSEIWASWNPTRRTDPIDAFFRTQARDNAICVRSNWRDNPFLSRTLGTERLDCLRHNPDGYGHIWEGDYVTVQTGAYYAAALTQARSEGRITDLTADPMLAVRTYHDIGGAGANADAYAIWVVQFRAGEIDVLDYYEAKGQVLATHANWLRANWPNAEVILPHDGLNTNNVTGKRIEDHWRDAGFQVRSEPNAGRGADAQRIEAARRLFPRMRFDAKRCEAGLAALGWYHERRDDRRGIGLGPEHDWSSHAADAFGLMALCYQEPVFSVRHLDLPVLSYA